MSFDYNPSEFVTAPEGWDCKRLVDCTIDGNISYGIVQPGQHDESGVPIVRVNNLNGGLNLSEVLKVSPEIESKYRRTRLKGGEVLLTLVGSTGQSLVAPDKLKDWNVPRAIAVIRASEEVGAEWINICLQSKEVKHFLDVRANTTVQKTLNLKDVRDIPILIPPKVVKEKIERVALSLVHKAQLNTQINQTLEQIAQALFKSWFIDFDPVKAKIATLQSGGSTEDAELAAMGVIAAKAPKELAELKQTKPETYQNLAQTAALFPSAMQESELGEIPEGWRVSNIGNTFKVVMGQSPKGETYNTKGEGVIFYQGRAEFGWRFPTPRLFTTAPSRMAVKNDVLMSVRAPVGDLNIALDDCCIGRGVCALRHISGSTSFSYHLLKQLSKEIEKFNGEGTVFGSINQKDLKALIYVEPSKDILDAFIGKVNSLDEEIEILSIESSTLVGVRDVLLPKLLSGEINLEANA